MGFLTLWLVGKLRCFDGSAHPSRLILALIPLGFAVWVGITRLQVMPTIPAFCCSQRKKSAGVI